MMNRFFEIGRCARISGCVALLGCFNVGAQTNAITHGIAQTNSVGIASGDPQPSLKIDGSTEDWKDFSVGWKKSSARNLPLDRFDISEFDYCNDTNYLYLFIKFKPSILEVYEPMRKKRQFGSLGTIGNLFIGRDLGSGSSRSIKQGFDIIIRAGTQIRLNDETNSVSPMASYRLKEWDEKSRRYDETLFVSNSIEDDRLIAFSDLGVELAIPLREIEKTRGATFDAIFEISGLDFTEPDRILLTIRLK